jgi:phosphate transport system substrate-binding protein
VTNPSVCSGARLPSFFLPLLLALLLVGCTRLLGSGGNTPPRPARLLIASSPALVPLISAAAALFERQHPAAQIEVQSRESPDGLSALAHRQADVAATALYADPASPSMPDLLDQLVCVIPFLVIVHPDVPLASLSQEQLQGIFSTGTITNWKQIGGQDQPLVVVLPPLTSDLRSAFREEVLGGAAEVGTALPTDSMETLRNTVARTPGSIGYLPGPLLDAQVRALAINGERATADRIAAGRYPFWSFAHLYTWADTWAAGTDEPMDMKWSFLSFMQSASVEQLARQLGYIPPSAIPVLSASGRSIASITPP